jgi:RHS repeat-associated protein
VTSGIKYWSDGTSVAGQQFDYTFDTIGNRTSTQAGGDTNGLNLRTASYTNNSLNQITSRDVPGYADVMGLTLASNTVSVNGTNAYQRYEYFREQLATNNTSAAQWMGINVTAPGQTAVSGHEFIAQTPENFTYDLDGNLTQDGRWTYTWDGENRLVNMTSLSGPPTPSLYNLNFTYDYLGRRIAKLVSTNNGSWVASYTNRFMYDGWNPVANLNPNASVAAAMMWGTDLSGSTQGAGGVGGLLAENMAANGVHFVAYDGNGNVAALLNAATGTVSANYEYGPFGELIRATGPMAKLNVFRFSTKYQDDETGFLYYGYRYYNPSTGRWLSRDPIGNNGGLNLYAFVNNRTPDRLDYLGMLYTASLPTPHTPTLPQEHESYLTFKPTCPKGYMFAFHDIDYGNIEAALLAAGFSAADIAQAKKDHGGFGGDASGKHPPGKPNCFGQPVEYNAYMETRFANWWGIELKFPDVVPMIMVLTMNGEQWVMDDAAAKALADKAIAAYVANTVLHYDCVLCACAAWFPSSISGLTDEP